MRTLDGKQDDPGANGRSALYIEYDRPGQPDVRAWTYLQADELDDLVRLYLDAKIRGLRPKLWIRPDRHSWQERTLDAIREELS